MYHCIWGLQWRGMKKKANIGKYQISIFVLYLFIYLLELDILGHRQQLYVIAWKNSFCVNNKKKILRIHPCLFRCGSVGGEADCCVCCPLVCCTLQGWGLGIWRRGDSPGHSPVPFLPFPVPLTCPDAPQTSTVHQPQPNPLQVTQARARAELSRQNKGVNSAETPHCILKRHHPPT